MAQPAADRLQAMLRRLLEPAPGRLALAARLALVCTLTTLVTQIYQTPSPALTAYVAFFLVKPDRAASLLLCVVMTLVMTVVIGGVFLVAQVVIDVAPW